MGVIALGYPFGYTKDMNAATLSISPWGNSHGIRLSRGLMQAMGIEPGTKLHAPVTRAGWKLWQKAGA